MPEIGGLIYFCQNCPGRGEYVDDVTPEDFDLYIQSIGNSPTPITEVFAGFARDSGGTNADLGGVCPDDDVMVRICKKIAEDPERERRLGERFCASIKNCNGAIAIEGPAHCPALNQIAFNQAIREV